MKLLSKKFHMCVAKMKITNKSSIIITRKKNVDPKLIMDQSMLGIIDECDAILDVGANVGEFVKDLRKLGVRKIVYSFEPILAAFEKLREVQSKDSQLKVYNVAIGETKSRKIINLANNNFASSSFLNFNHYHKDAAPNIEFFGTEEVDVITISDFLSQENINNIFVKIDVQGWEIKVLEGVSENDWKKIRGFRIEVNLSENYVGSSSMFDVLAFLKSKGFSIYRIAPGFGMPNFGRLLQAEVLFTR
jgi:FkbM family methyltransferase